MADKKETLPHEKIIDNIYKKSKMIDDYVFTVKFEHEDALHSAKKKIIDSKGAGAKDYLDSEEGHKDFAKIAANEFESRALKRYNVTDKSKIHEFDLEGLVEKAYGINEKVMHEFIRQTGSNFDFGIYKEMHLDEHNKRLVNNLSQKLVDFDYKQNSALLKHIGADKYLSDSGMFNHETFSPQIVNAILAWNKGKNTFGSDSLKKLKFEPYLKDDYKK